MSFTTVKKAFFFTLALTTLNAWTLEFNPGVYELIKGNPNFCEDGPLLIKGDRFILGSKLVFLNYQTPSLNFMNEAKDCEYSIKNIHDKKNYEQQLTVKCKKAPIYNKSTQFYYENADLLMMTIKENGQTYSCELKLKK